ncbi:PREDICTED: uncharacterized protein LOC104769334 [Camelina sativa]|uniref:Uncharacterized protein LOC104769334 n=1 Tax=Camelina sativa TaxID=90675 RepID=A0ABM1RFP5_CAMSA|nr:PREDICTED: uncharacterized protein LOC104784772 isoform X2 [Camelina sativa]XP_010518462.1 PREDICTED: uncharacterized protein LOC104793748 [Camelina sativa]XP_019097833.1 PREDICTED: uncharacterized protein LOC104769334 [Camelina sativa]
MPLVKKPGRKRNVAPNASLRPGGSNPSSKVRRLNPLPSQYNFTPAAENPTPPTPPTPQEQVRVSPQISTSAAPQVRNYPPPQILFQSSVNRVGVEHPSRSSTEVMNNPPVQSNPLEDSARSPNAASHAQSHPSSQGHNFAESDPVLPELQEDTLRALNAILMVPDRHTFTTVLSPEPKPNTTWFTRDAKSALVRKITRVFTNKFDGPFYNWSCVPPDRRERYFLEFAKTHTWDPLITGTVQQYFYDICQRRMKNMVSDVRTSRVQPKWIEGDLWKVMVAQWETEEAQERSRIYSKARMSDRNGLGPHMHLSGPTSYQQVKQGLEEKLGRPVSLGEVFKETHTKPDGTYVDRKAEKIFTTYEKNLQAKLSEIESDPSQVHELTAEDYTAIFLQSTEKDSRGNIFGLGSLKDHLQGLLNGSSYHQQGQSSSFVALQEQMKEAQRIIEEQVAYATKRDAEFAAREAEHSKVVAEQQKKIDRLEKFMQKLDPAFLEFHESESSDAPIDPPT